MKTIYFLRHFKVKDNINVKLNSRDFNNWVDMYDTFEQEYCNIDLPDNIDKIYSSTLNRAVKTTKHLTKNFELTKEIIEVEAYPFFNTKFKFSKKFWLFTGRLLWYFNLTQKEKKSDTKRRVKEFIEKLQKENSDTVLLVSHGLFLKVFVKELQRYGFTGDVDLALKSGIIYKLSRTRI